MILLTEHGPLQQPTPTFGFTSFLSTPPPFHQPSASSTCLSKIHTSLNSNPSHPHIVSPFSRSSISPNQTISRMITLLIFMNCTISLRWISRARKYRPRELLLCRGRYV